MAIKEAEETHLEYGTANDHAPMAVYTSPLHAASSMGYPEDSNRWRKYM